MTILVGNDTQSTLYTIVAPSTGQLDATEFVASASGPCTQGEMYVGYLQGTTTIYLCVYDSAGNLLGQSEGVTPTASGWAVFTFATAFAISAGSSYWLAAWSNGNSDLEIGQGGTGHLYYYNPGGWPTAPSAYSSEGQQPGNALSAYLLENTTIPTVVGINGALGAPSGVAVTTATTGGSIPASTTRYYVVTATNEYGESTASLEVSVETGSGTSTNENTLTFTLPAGSTGGRVYWGSTSEQENFYLPFSSGSTTSWTDTGAAGFSGVPPSFDTTGAWVAEGSSNVSLAGTNFASGLSASITQGSNTLAQAATYVSATSATFDLKMEQAIGAQLAFTDSTYPTTLTVTASTGTSPAAPATLVPAAGNIFKTVLSSSREPYRRIETLPDLAIGDQIEASGNAAGTAAAPAGLALNPDGTFEYTNGAWANFYVRVYKASDSAWTPWAEIVCTGLAQADGFD